MQETHCDKGNHNRWKNEWGSKIWFDDGSTAARGVAILVKKSLNIQITEAYRLENFKGRFLAIKVLIDNKEFLLVNLYGPNTDFPSFYEQVFACLESTGIDHKIIAGDFNLTINDNVDRIGSGMHKNKQARVKIQEQLENGLVDIWRECHARGGFTWRRKKPTPLCERLDFFLIASSLQQMVQKIEVQPNYLSDHSGVVLSMSNNFKKRGKGYWKLNTSLLKDLDYLEKINNLLEVELAQ